MQKPKPPDVFANEADEHEHMLDCICWLYAEDMSLDLGIPQEECADSVKRLILTGRFIIDLDEKRDGVRLIPAPSQATN